MALVKCPECGRENVSDSAESCPTCGYGIKEHFESKKRMDSVSMPKEPEKRETRPGGCFWCFALLGFVWFFIGEGAGIIIALIYWGLLGIWMYIQNKDSQKEYEKELADYELAKKNFEEYKKRMVIEQDEEDARKPTCPNCGSKEVSRMTNLERDVSMGVNGLASSKIGKQYRCRNCGHLW